MWVKVLKPFRYAPDGMRVRELSSGDVLQVHDDLIEGLHAEGLIEAAEEGEIEAAATGAVLVAEPVEIPDDWADLHWFKLRALARKLNAGAPPKDKAAAKALVEAELARRAHA